MSNPNKNETGSKDAKEGQGVPLPNHQHSEGDNADTPNTEANKNPEPTWPKIVGIGTLVFDGILALAAIIGFVFLSDQLELTRQSNGLTQESNRLTQESNKISRESARAAQKAIEVSSRPYIGFAMVQTLPLSDIVNIPASEAAVHLTITNSGNTTATNYVSCFAAVLADETGNNVDPMTCEREREGGVANAFAMLPHASMHFSIPLQIPPETIRDLSNGQSVLYVIGWFQYDDPFGNTYKEPFCWARNVSGTFGACPGR